MIRLALGTLAADNAHHQFEHLCRHLAKRRIASNILPATGPVSAGGDQGRDFETFRTYLAGELPFALGFLALASSDVVVFACTIQKDKLRGKFEDDIKSICTQGTHVDRIYIFATASVTTALRHDLQEWAAQEHHVARGDRRRGGPGRVAGRARSVLDRRGVPAPARRARAAGGAGRGTRPSFPPGTPNCAPTGRSPAGSR